MMAAMLDVLLVVMIVEDAGYGVYWCWIVEVVEVEDSTIKGFIKMVSS